MPRGDRTGPLGLGPMTGRAMGYCAGYPTPGFMNPWPGMGYGRGPGFGRGFGMGRGIGFGRGRGWARGGFWGFGGYPYPPMMPYGQPYGMGYGYPFPQSFGDPYGMGYGAGYSEPAPPEGGAQKK